MLRCWAAYITLGCHHCGTGTYGPRKGWNRGKLGLVAWIHCSPSSRDGVTSPMLVPQPPDLHPVYPAGMWQPLATAPVNPYSGLQCAKHSTLHARDTPASLSACLYYLMKKFCYSHSHLNISTNSTETRMCESQHYSQLPKNGNHLSNGILFGRKQQWSLIHITPRMDLACNEIMLSYGIQSHKTTYCMRPFMQNIRNGQVHREPRAGMGSDS
jgi:hypothetical protein